jgi:hypothetical protein
MNGDVRTRSCARPTSIGSKAPHALKIPARRAEYSLAENAASPFQAEPRHNDKRASIKGSPPCAGIWTPPCQRTTTYPPGEPGLLPVCRQTGNDRMLLNLIAKGKRLSGAEQIAEMEHLIHFAQKVTS